MKVLIVSAVPVRRAATGTEVTVNGLFSGWPRDSLMQAFIGEADEAEELVGAPLAIPPNAAWLDYAFRSAVRKAGLLRGSLAPASGVVPVLGPRSARTRMHMTMRYVADASPMRVPRHVFAQAREFDPDVIYSLLGSLRMIRLANLLSDSLGKPVVPHFMDDWPGTLYGSQELWGMPRRSLLASLSALMGKVPLGLAIGDAMSLEYSERFGVPFASVSNPAGEEYFAVPPGGDAEAPVLAYVGGLHLGRGDVLRRFAETLAELGGETPLRLVVHCPDQHLELYGGGLERHECVEIRGSVTPDQVPSVLESADILVHVESFDPSEMAFTRLSVSTKLSQYLAAGRPVISFGPDSLASTLLVRQSGGGIAAADDRELRSALKTLADPETRRTMGRRGRSYAQSRFSQAAMSTTLRDALQAAGDAGRRDS